MSKVIAISMTFAMAFAKKTANQASWEAEGLLAKHINIWQTLVSYLLNGMPNCKIVSCFVLMT